MKRDLDLIRRLLLTLEGKPAGIVVTQFSEFPNTPDAELFEHIQLLLDADLVEGQVARSGKGSPVACAIMRITNKGHEFLDNARNDDVWNKVVRESKSKGVSLSLDVLAKIMGEIVAGMIRG
jgi:hypothetical protein